MKRMKRLAKHEGFGNVVVEEADVPQIGAREILVRIHRSLISRGSEIGGRYRKETAVDPQIMGYSAAGVVEAVGKEVGNIAVGDRAMVVAPHAEYGVGKMDWLDGAACAKLPDAISFEHATFIPLATSSVGWARSACIKEGDTVAILGQGLVGLLCLQTVREMKPGKVVAVDALDMRCALAAKLGADVVVNVSKQDPVKAVREATGGKGADVVMDCVGGPAGVKSFAQAQDMVKGGGVVQVVGLYQESPLPLEAGKIQGKLVVGDTACVTYAVSLHKAGATTWLLDTPVPVTLSLPGRSPAKVAPGQEGRAANMTLKPLAPCRVEIGFTNGR